MSLQVNSAIVNEPVAHMCCFSVGITQVNIYNRDEDY